MKRAPYKEILLILLSAGLFVSGLFVIFNTAAFDYCKQVLYFCTATAFTYYKYTIAAFLAAGLVLAVLKTRHLYHFPQASSALPFTEELANKVRMFAPEASNLKFFSIRNYPGVAFTAGFFKPAIFINPEKLNRLSDEEKLAVLLHEVAHAHFRDPLIIAITEFVHKLLFFVPLVHYARERVLVYLEKRADSFAALRLNDELSVASAIVKSARFVSSQSRTIAVPAFSTKASTVEERVLHLTDRADFLRFTRLIFYTFLTLIVFALLFLPPSIFADTSCCVSSISTICCN